MHLKGREKKKTKTIHTKHEIWRYQPCVMWLCLCAERANRLRVRELAAAKALGSPFENHTLLRLCLFCFRWLSLPSLVAALLGAAADWYGEGRGGGEKICTSAAAEKTQHDMLEWGMQQYGLPWNLQGEKMAFKQTKSRSSARSIGSKRDERAPVGLCRTKAISLWVSRWRCWD